jgi:hypothetical protein
MAERVKGVQNLHTLAMSGFGLGVFCTSCHHRSVLSHPRMGDMTELRKIGFRCTGCGQRGTGADLFALYIFHDQAEIDDFSYGQEKLSSAASRAARPVEGL